MQPLTQHVLTFSAKFQSECFLFPSSLASFPSHLLSSFSSGIAISLSWLLAIDRMQPLAEQVLLLLRSQIRVGYSVVPRQNLDTSVSDQCVGYCAFLLLAEASADEVCSISA
jgi:hypothetical protein